MRDDLVLNMDGVMGSFLLKDKATMKGSLYEKIASVEGEQNTIKLKLVAYLSEFTKLGDFDLSISLILSTIKINIISRVIFEIAHYFIEMYETGMKILPSQNNVSPKIYLKLDISQPIFAIPRDSQSELGFVANLGEISLVITDKKKQEKLLKYEKKYDEQNNFYWYHNISLDVKDLCIYSIENVLKEEEEENRQYFFSKFSTEIIVNVPLSPSKEDSSAAQVFLDLEAIYLSLNEYQIDLLISILGGNISEQNFLFTQTNFVNLNPNRAIKEIQDNLPAEVTLKLGEMRLSICKGFTRKDTEEIVYFSFSDIDISVLSFPDFTVEVALSLKSFNMIDNKNTNGINKFPKLIETVPQEDKEKNMMSVFVSVKRSSEDYEDSYVEVDSKKIILFLNYFLYFELFYFILFFQLSPLFQFSSKLVNSIRVNLMPHIYWDLANMIVPKVVNLPITLNSLKKIIYKIIGKKVANKGVTIMDLHILPQIVILHDYTDFYSNSLLLNCNFEMYMEESVAMTQTFNMEITNLELYKCKINDKDFKKNNILESFNSQISVQKNRTEFERVMVKAGEMKFTISHQDVLLIQKITETWLEAAQKKPLNFELETDMEVLQESINFVSNIDLKIKGISARLVDEYGESYLPVLLVRILRSHANIIMSSKVYDYLKVRAKVNLYVDCFNVHNQSWEPLIRGLYNQDKPKLACEKSFAVDIMGKKILF